MSITVTATVGGTSYRLDNGVYSYLLAHDGWGAAPARRLVSRGYQQNGDTDRGYRLESRQASLTLGLPSSSLDTMYSKRERLNRIFSPGASITLTWDGITGYSDGLAIDVVYAGQVEMPWMAQRGGYERVTYVLRAADPTFYNPQQQGVDFLLIPDGMTVPTLVPTLIGGGSPYLQTISYAGSADSYPIVRIFGPITDPVITNQATGDKLDFTGVTIAGGDFYTIDCAYGAKTVTNAAGTSKIAELTDDSDLSTFRILAPVDGSSSRSQVISVTGSGAGSGSQAQVLYYERYLGI